MWNVAFAPLLFWDGRAASLEAQVRFPVVHPDEMGSSLESAALRLAKDGDYVRAFGEAFPGDGEVSAANIAKALAAYERTLISPPTRLDQWVAGQADALTKVRDRRLSHLRRQGPLHRLPQRLRLHRP